ncbi:MAG: methylated-DNA--[protein]-cysteine S-methyltransferase [Eubacteriales bacterium]|nr:methylated-DNA--[protein]-cysteine S-methyltransferase [Eubacteriales bacterium]
MRIACRAKTAVGVFTAIYEDGVITRVLFPGEPFSAAHAADDTLPFAEQVTAYFEGRRKSFSLPVIIPGTRFSKDVYAATLRIPYGRTATYSDVAIAAGYPRAMRAVGNAMRANPLPLIIPCHRVVHKSNRKCAYRGGIPVKHYLLSVEKKYSAT